ncbi:non-ribosomal peptide synthetase [Trinickia soli]|nr:non-ribosomal peptide synthetase [Trinickia soli]
MKLKSRQYDLEIEADLARELASLSTEIDVSIDHLIFSGWLLLLHQVVDQDEVSVRVRDTRDFVYTSLFNPHVQWQTFAAATSARLIEASRAGNVDAHHSPLGHDVALYGCETGYCIRAPSAEPATSAEPHWWLRASEGGNGVWTLHCMTTSPSTITRRHLDLLQSMMRALTQGRRVPIAAISAISAEERARVIRFNDTAREYPADRTLIDLVAQWVRKDAARTALGDNDVTLSRGALMQQACNLAQHLITMGVTKGDPVALLMERDASMVVATLAVLIAGGVYCPIDPSYPEARVRYYLEDTRARVLLVSGETGDALSSNMTSDGTFSGCVSRADRRSIGLLSPASVDDLLSRSISLPDDPAYIMYTSGTTGTPKGVLVTHRGVVRLVRGADYVELDEDTRMLQAGAIGFDAATFEIWGALLNGGELHVIDRDALLSPRLFEDFVARRRCNTGLLTSSLFAMMSNESPGVFRHFRSIVVGGDVIPSKQVQSVRRLCPELTVINAYGPTENSVISTAHIVSDEDALDIPIGKPISNTTAYVLSRHRQVQPIGVPGELYVGGAGIGPGYLHKPEQTAASFVTVDGLGGETLYRTGDIVSWRESGVLDFIGRRDHQIKIRGLRVEIGEIERQLLAAAEIEEALVLSRKVGSHGDPTLTAYFKAPVEIDTAVLRDLMRKRLPPHMVPSNFEQLDVMPLTANGKVDRRLLLEHCATRVGPAASNMATTLDPNADRHDLTSVVMRELTALLARTDISASANFLALGGSSLTAALLASRLEAQCQRRCMASDILNSDSLEQFASVLGAAPALTGYPFPCATEGRAGWPGAVVGGRRVASIAQKQIFVEQAKFPQSTAYNLPLEIVVPRGRIDTARLRDALQSVVDRHETMRTSFTTEDGNVVRHVQLHLEADLEVAELEDGAPARAASPDAYREWARRWVRPFDLTSAPLWRFAVVSDGSGTRVFCDFHHIIVDGKSIATLLRDLSDAYGPAVDEADSSIVESRAGSKDDRPFNDASFDRYIDWMTSGHGAERTARNETFWKAEFGDWSAPSDLPTDYPRAPVRDWRGGAWRFSLGAGLTARVQQFALTHRVTPYSVLLCSYALWLASVTGEAKPTIGTAAAGRSMPGSEHIAGLFVNTVCLRLDVVGHAQTQTVSAWVMRSARKINTCLDHQDYPFLRLVEQYAANRTFDRHPLFDSMFAMQNTGMSEGRFWGSPVAWRPEYTGASLFDLNLQIEIGECEFSAIWTYNAQLFNPDTVERFAEHWLSIVDVMIRNGDRGMSALLADPAVGLEEADPAGTSRLPSISFTL